LDDPRRGRPGLENFTLGRGLERHFRATLTDSSMTSEAMTRQDG
jgi:hypothetical protein